MISEEEFSSLARLARLDPEDESLSGLRGDFNQILDFVNSIQEVHEAGSGSEIHADNEITNVTRTDRSESPLGLDTLSDFAPDWEAGHFVVPGVLDQEH